MSYDLLEGVRVLELCMAVDVSGDGGRQVLMDLVKRSDVFITNLLASARRRFKISPGHGRTLPSSSPLAPYSEQGRWSWLGRSPVYQYSN